MSYLLNMIKLSDAHKQKLWADFLSWSGGKSFYEVPLLGCGSEIGVSDFLESHNGIEGWLNTLPGYMHAATLEWVDGIQRAHLRRDADIFASYSKDYMYDKCWRNGWPLHFKQVAQAELPAVLEYIGDMVLVAYTFQSPALTVMQTTAQKRLGGDLVMDLQLVVAEVKKSVADELRRQLKEEPLSAETFTTAGLKFRTDHPVHDYFGIEVQAKLDLGLPAMKGVFANFLPLLRLPKGAPQKLVQASEMNLQPKALAFWNATQLLEEIPLQAFAAVKVGDSVASKQKILMLQDRKNSSPDKFYVEKGTKGVVKVDQDGDFMVNVGKAYTHYKSLQLLQRDWE